MGKQDLEIARRVTLKPIQELGAVVGLAPDELEPYGRYKAKVAWEAITRRRDHPDGALVLVTAMTPTPAGEGKSTTTVGLADGLRRLGKRAVVALREPSLGPVFGMKGGATGGGHAQVAPMEDINLHFTGDMHAIGGAHNLLAAMLDNHLAQGNPLGIDTRRVLYKRGDRHERPGAAQHRPRTRWTGARRSARGRFRDHGRLGDHGDPVPVGRPR
jgi:formate--tetrahydrofolate ligase